MAERGAGGVNNVLLLCCIRKRDWNGVCSAPVLGGGPVVRAIATKSINQHLSALCCLCSQKQGSSSFTLLPELLIYF